MTDRELEACVRGIARGLGVGIRSGGIAAAAAMCASVPSVERMPWALLVAYLVFLSVRWEFDR